MLKSLCQSVIVFSESDASSPTWPTGDRTTATFGTRTLLLAPLVSSQRVHVLHGDVPSEVDASTSLCLVLSRQKRARSELTPASSYTLLAALLSTKPRPQLRRAPLSTLHPLARRETHR